MEEENNRNRNINVKPVEEFVAEENPICKYIQTRKEVIKTSDI